VFKPDHDLPSYSAEWAGELIVLEAEPGKARSELLRRWLEGLSGVEVSFVSCNLSIGGIWAGLKDLMESVLPRISSRRPDLVQSHSYEITTVLPAMRTDLKVEYVPLTELVPANEKVRKYAMDRAFRILNGLIDFLAEWRRSLGFPPWIIVCEDFDGVGALVGRFFRDLIRREGKNSAITLVLAVGKDQSDRILGSLDTRVRRMLLARDLARDEKPSSGEHFRKAALELESVLGNDLVQLEIHLPRLIHFWKSSDMPERALRWDAMAFAIYNHFGFYEDALIYGEAILPHLDFICEQDRRFTRWQLVGGIYNTYICVGLPEEALRVMETEAIGRLTDHADLARADYIMAMLHARFLPTKNLGLAEKYIESGLRELELSSEPVEERHFFKVFLWNGLALIRHRQGRAKEAIDLCQQGSKYLDEHLSAERHLLHRSVLLYNIGQVYAAIGDLDESISYYTAAMEMDPYYSEYFNERGSLYLRAGKPAEAIEDYLRAIELSPPYFEVFSNLGQAYKMLGRHPEALRAFSRAIDLEPYHTLPLVRRAQVYDHLGLPDEALADYSAALEIDSRQPFVLANRAALLFDKGSVQEAVTDLDEAIRQAPDFADFLSSRAIGLLALGKPSEAADDLRRYLALAPNALDADEIRLRLDQLAASVDAACDELVLASNRDPGQTTEATAAAEA
jgi:tetratricopeptide (TPR) repeat protein